MAREKDLNWSLYYDCYGEFLTPRQAEMFSMYYEDDYSLAEIAQHMNISRQAVLDGIRRAQARFTSMEQRLHLVEQRTGKNTEDENGL